MKLPESVKEIIIDNINSAFVPMLLAAPEMLEALKLARDELNIELARFGNGTSKGALRNARDAAQFAIAQAEGRV